MLPNQPDKVPNAGDAATVEALALAVADKWSIQNLGSDRGIQSRYLQHLGSGTATDARLTAWEQRCLLRGQQNSEIADKLLQRSCEAGYKDRIPQAARDGLPSVTFPYASLSPIGSQHSGIIVVKIDSMMLKQGIADGQVQLSELQLISWQS